MTVQKRTTYVPIPGSHHVYLNGLEMQEGVDWNDDGTGLITVETAGDPKSGDLLEIRYAHYGEATVVPPAEVVHSAFSDALNPTLTLPGGVVEAGDTLFLTCMQVNGTQTGPAGFSVYDSGVWGGVLWWMYTKTAVGGETSVSVSTPSADSSHRTATGLVVLRGSIAESSPETEGTTETSAAVPILTTFATDQVAFVVSVSAHGVTSGSITQPGAPYVFIGEQDSALGKFTVNYAYWTADASSNPAGTVQFTGTAARHNVRTLRVVL